jgi:beta-glucanase (GH16 family)
MFHWHKLISLMKIIYLVILLAILSAGCKKNTATKIPDAPRLIWSDEFDYAGLPDATKWGYEVGGNGWGNNELQYYTNASTNNARVANGILTIEARKESIGGNAYSSARLVTKGKLEFQYGKIEIRAKLPYGRGTWPALWMLGANNNYTWPNDGEIDIMEHVGYDLGNVYGTIHTKSYNHTLGTQRSANTFLADCHQAFHVYSLDWSSQKIVIAVDGINFFTFTNENTGYDTWPFNNKMFLLLNIAVGGSWGGIQGVDNTIFPAKMEVDYVRVYQ